MKLENIHSVYFIGIGGIGMSAIARWFNQRGAIVGGYDRVETPLTSRLETEGIWIHYNEQIGELPKVFLEKEGSLIVYTPAVPKGHRELIYFQDNGFVLKKRSEVLGIISQGHYTVAVGGTHGKTTTSSMVAHLLSNSEKGCSAFVGGIMTNYDSNLIVGREDAPLVVEADEFDRSFHRLSPNFEIISSVDPDHLDIYGDEDEMKKSFAEFVAKNDPMGRVLVQHEAAGKLQSKLDRSFLTYGIEKGDIKAKEIRVIDGAFVFDYHGKTEIRDLKLEVPGYHNVENAIAAITVAIELGMEETGIREALASYRGVKRRFEYIIKDENLIFIDDYAHHPTEIKHFLKSVRTLYPGKKITVVFQPHLYSRTRDFYPGFAESLALADDVILLDIYPAREEPIPGVSSAMIFNLIRNNSKTLCTRETLLDEIEGRGLQVFCTIGAGDIDQEVPRLKEKLLKEYRIEE